MAMMSYMEALRDGMRIAMKNDPNVFLAGEDVGAFGGCFGQTQGLFEEFGPKRIIDTPISETAILGLATGAAAVGLRPIVEIMFVDFMGVCMDELLNNAAKMHYMFGGKISVPMVVRAPCGAGFSAAAQHSQSLDSWFAHIPGIKVVAPGSPADAKGLMLAAIRDNNPVIYLEHKGLFGMSGEVPEGDYEVPLGKADIKREGRDVTIVTWSAMVNKSLEAAKLLAQDGIEAEVLDLRSIAPLDTDAILDSVARTNRLVIVHEEVLTAGFGGEIAALVADKGFDLLDAPIKRVAPPDTPVPFSPVLEQAFIPQAPAIVAAVKELF
ncbi:MAG: alpha-ketoacid dehydrogenase subunit beta [Rhodospirillaceae bacterium]|nr:alpha-ketoacid dehydrogenase subunit beta [Rhodospirillaceae bacterium]